VVCRLGNSVDGIVGERKGVEAAAVRVQVVSLKTVA